jgi:hypothetical protein
MAFDPLAPVRLGFRIGIGVLRFELRVVEHLLGLDRDQPDVVVADVVVADVVVAEPQRFEPEPAPPRPTRAARPQPKPEPEPFRDIEIPAAAEFELEPEAPAHIDTEPELVGEFAESGAEEGAGAEIHVAEPWSGYRRMRVADIVDRVGVADPATLAVVQLYESSQRSRRSVLGAVERRSKQLANAPAGR